MINKKQGQVCESSMAKKTPGVNCGASKANCRKDDSDSIIDQAKEKASDIAEKVKAATGSVVGKAGDMLDGMADKAHDLAEKMGNK